jgi:hypothetical protein
VDAFYFLRRGVFFLSGAAATFRRAVVEVVPEPHLRALALELKRELVQVLHEEDALALAAVVGLDDVPPRAVLYKRMSGWSSKASEAELKGVAGGD